MIFPLYLAQEHYSAATIGVVLTGGSLLGAVVVTSVGIVSDRIGRRPVLITLGLLGTLGALALAANPDLWVVMVASGMGGIGRGGGAGSGGAFGPFFPAEQPLLAASVTPARRTGAFAVMGFIGVIGAALGSLAAGLPMLVHPGISADSSYRILFVISAAGSLVTAGLSAPLRDVPREPKSSAAAAPSPTVLSTRQLISRLGITNALNGLGFGFLGPLLTYWFYVRFHVGAAEVGTLYTVANLVSALPYLGAGRIVSRLGAVRTVVVTRGVSVALLLAMAPAPSFVAAASLLCLRAVCNSLGMPARQVYTMGAAQEGRRGTVAALGSLPSVVTSSVSPAIGGALMGVFLDVPIVGAAIFMAANTVAYYLAFRHAPLPEETSASIPAESTPVLPDGE